MNVKRKRAFTLIELMVVIAVITILMAIAFKLMRAAAYAKAEAETKSRMARIENCLSGFYAANGYYPPVPFFVSLDPKKNGMDPDGRNTIGESDWEGRAQLTARAQPVSFEHPTPTSMDSYIPKHFEPRDVVAVNQIPGQIDDNETSWTNVKMFKWGLLSFLLPRVEVVGNPHTNGGNAPSREILMKKQWMSQSADEVWSGQQMEKQRIAENAMCAKWLPNLEHIVSGGPNVLGIATWTEGGGLTDRPMMLKGGGQRQVALITMTLRDGWGREFYYHSPPPYQSYRIWSAGGDGKTYPPWIPADEREGGDKSKKEKIAGWLKDDIVGGSL